MIRIQKALEKSAIPNSFIVTDGSNEPTYKTVEQVKELLAVSNEVVSFYDGISTQSSNGTTLIFEILHGAPDVPTFVSITPASLDAWGYKKVTANNSTISIEFEVAPPVGANNLIFNWLVVSVGNVSIEEGGGVSLPTDLGYISSATTGTVTSSTGVDAVIPAATTSIAGLLTSADKIKLDAIVGGVTNLSVANRTSTTLDVLSDTGNDATLPFATTSLAGLLTSADKTKLDGIATGANLYTHPNHSGDVVSVSDGATTIQAGVVTNTKLATMSASTIKGSIVGGAPVDLTVAQVKTMLAYTATDVVNTPSGNIAATTVQTALNELDVEKNVNILFQEEGVDLGATGTVNTINFTGANITASRVGNVVTVDVTGGSGGGVTNLTYSSAASTGTVNSDTGTDATIPAATTSIAGLLTSADKTKLDGITSNANNYSHPNHTGDVTSISDGATTISTNAVTFAKFQQVATGTLIGRSTAGTGNVEALTLGAGLTLSAGVLSSTVGTVTSVGITGTDFTIGSSPITTSGTISLAIANNVVTNAKLAQAPANTLKGNNTGALANEADLTIAQVKTLLSYTATDITNTAAGNIAAITVQGALNELDGEKQTNIQFQEEGTNLGSTGTVTTINFTGTPVTASRSGNVLTVAISSGSTPLNGDEIRVVSANTTLSASTDDTVVFNTASTTATLPTPTNKKKLVVKNVSTGTIVVSGNIDGTASATYTLQSYEAMGFHSNGTTWYIIN